MGNEVRSRLKRAEAVIADGTGQREFERLKREFYNMRLGSDALLLAVVRASLGEIELPTWAAGELNRPIPADCLTDVVRMAEDDARDQLSGLDKYGGVDAAALIQELNESVLAPHGFRNLREAQWFFETIDVEGVLFSDLLCDWESGRRKVPADYV